MHPFTPEKLLPTSTTVTFTSNAVASRQPRAPLAPRRRGGWQAFLALGLSLFLSQGIIATTPVQAQGKSASAQADRRNDVVRAVEALAPSVVSISTEQLVRSGPFGGGQSLFDYFQGLEPKERLERASLGTGVIITPQGHILTNEHVIRGAARVTATLNDDREVECEVIGSDPDNDLAVLKMIKPGAIQPARLGTSNDLMIGESVIAIGNPYGLSQTVTTGVVSANYRSFRVEDKVYRNFIQTDAAINPGNSGGPLLNIRGEVIGINSAIYGNAQGLGFAIPIDKAKRVLADLIQYGQRQPAWIGLEVQEEPMQTSGRSGRRGGSVPVTVVAVHRGSPAEKAGLRPGDRIVSLDKGRVDSVEDYYATVRQLGVNDELVMTIERTRGAQSQVKVRTIGFPEELIEQLIGNKLGIKVVGLNETLARQYQLNTAEGLLISEVKRGSVLGAIGIQPGDVIRKANGALTNEEKDLKEALVRGWDRGGVMLAIQRGRLIYNVPTRF